MAMKRLVRAFGRRRLLPMCALQGEMLRWTLRGRQGSRHHRDLVVLVEYGSKVGGN